MNILFLTIGRIDDVDEASIYLDLIRHFRDNGHSVYCVSISERRNKRPTTYTCEKGISVLRVRVGNIKNCSIIEKGISTVLLEYQYKNAVKKYMSDVKFDLVLYSTPPITLAGVIQYLKKRDNARTYLMLKDIFPQNAVDIEMMSKSGLSGILYKYFRNKEKRLYALSDTIGCMSQANCEYVLKHNPELSPEKVEICPNATVIRNVTVTAEERATIREKYNIPLDKLVFVYGGNLGKPQGIPFIIDCLRAEKDNSDIHFLIVGDGTEYGKLETFLNNENVSNVSLMKKLPRDDYNKMVAACDVGMIFLDHRFTIPNFPSRLLGYMQAGLPVLACTDPNTDIGAVITEGGFGWWCESDNVAAFSEQIKKIKNTELTAMHCKAIDYLTENYSVDNAYGAIVSSHSKS